MVRCTQGDFAACGRRVTLPAAAKSPKRRRGTAQDGHFVSIFAHPTPSDPSGHLPLTGGVGPGPHYGGRVPESQQKISGAQNLSGWSKFLPGHFVVADFVSLASPGSGKARSLHRSSSPTQTRCAGLCVGDRLQRPVWVENFSRCGSISTPGLTDQVAAGLQSAGRSGTGPYERRDGL